MFRIIFRQRRRILTGMFLVCLGIGMELSSYIGEWAPNSPWFITLAALLVTLLICGVIYASAAVVWIWLFPNWRFMIEQMGFHIFVFATIKAIWPTYFTFPVLGGCLPFVVSLAAVMLVYGNALDRFPLTLGLKQKRSYKSNRSPEILWEELVPMPDTIETHWDRLLHSLEPDPNNPNIQHAKYHHGASMFQVQRQELLEENFPNHFFYRFDGDVSEANKLITGGRYTIQIEPFGENRSRVTLTEENDALFPRVALQLWFDDELGDRADFLKTRETGKRDFSLTNLHRKRAATLS